MSDIPFSVRPNGISANDVAETYATIADLTTKEDILTFTNYILAPFSVGKIERSGNTVGFYPPDFTTILNPYLTTAVASSTYEPLLPTKVYSSVFKNGDKVITSVSTTFTTVDDMTIDYQSGSDYNISSGEFTAPRTAIYIIDYAINVIDDSPNYTEFIGSTVSVDRGSGYVREMYQNYADINRKTLLITIRSHYMTQLNTGDKVKNELEIFNAGGTVATIRGFATSPRSTYQTIHSIT